MIIPYGYAAATILITEKIGDRNNMTESSQPKKPAQNTQDSGNRVFADLVERVRSGELKARMHYFLFRKGQEAKRSDSILSRYKRRLAEKWPKWLGIGAGITGLFMFLSPEAFSLWQIPLVFILMLLAPAFFELPNTLNALFGHSEHQHLVGSNITLTQPIANGKGQTTLENQEWMISGPDCPTGSTVTIITLDAKTLYVTLSEQKVLSQGADNGE
ncbi:MAG: Membrane protein implicated in regulation of membrane protease activity [uncultured Thiotrichaceae bacterium]|uniref:Membrane protein implicated in regulation of membrane protease activity n=1 Tax=uncultured Thiotrichaceae bacterium TaxID=298394 RepID=A0A6S6S993_9GAMM|nr:MAG: Membrane protein implicated in regulation of membrane protease activity [uncultured Thiotrichaceae bacterium]